MTNTKHSFIKEVFSKIVNSITVFFSDDYNPIIHPRNPITARNNMTPYDFFLFEISFMLCMFIATWIFSVAFKTDINPNLFITFFMFSMSNYFLFCS